MTRVVATTLILTAVALAARAQSSRDIPASTSLTTTISGRVVADDTGDPIPNARVSLATPAQGTPVVLTDGDGRFAFTAAPGRHTVVASKSGYPRREAAAAGESQPIEIRLRRGAAISGRVVDEFGDPVPLALVAAETLARSPTRFTTVATSATDDRGEYRLAGLPGCPHADQDCSGGTFAVSLVTLGAASIPAVGDNTRVFQPDPRKIYYPGATMPDGAQELRLQPGEERSGIDFVLSAAQAGGQPFSVTTASPLTRPIAPNPAARATGIVRGRVVSTEGRALSHAQVRLFSMRDVQQSNLVRADDDGRFEFLDLPAGTFRVAASKAGYTPVPSDEPAIAGPPFLSSGRSVDLAEGETRERVDISLARRGTLSGRVFDELGDPLQGAHVQLLQVRYEAGRRRLVAAGGAARPTDDLGRYRLFMVPPGQYIVSAAVGAVMSSDLPGYARSYYPGTPNPGEAQYVSIGTAQDVVGIDISLSRTRTARVAGRTINAAGEPTKGGSLMLVASQRSTSVTSVSVGARISPDGAFEFPNVPAGQYVIQAYRGRSNAWIEGEFGALPVSVNGDDVVGLVLQISSGSSIAGRFVYETYDRSKTYSPSAVELAPLPVDFDVSPSSNLATANVHADSTFEILGINGPRRLQLRRAPEGWALKEIRVNGIDVTDRPLPFGRKDQSLTDVEVVLTDRISELRGTIADDRARPAPGATVIVVSMDRERWYPASRFVRKTIAGADGTFTIAGLPMGSYYAVARARAPADGEDAWQDPAFLESLVPRASTVTIGDGQKQSLNFRLATPASPR